MRRLRRHAAAVVFAAICAPATTGAQGFEVAPFGGYRFGGDPFELVTRRPVDLDGAPAVGVVVDVPIGRRGAQFEGLFSHQAAQFTLSDQSLDAARWAVNVDYWQVGGAQEFRHGAVRPFVSGTIGLARYAAAGDSEVRFAVSAGGGVKLFPIRQVGLRLDGRVFATLIDGDGRVVACAPGICVAGLHVDVAWQAEFTAGLILAIR